MEELDLDLFGRLVAVPGVSGREGAVRRLFHRELEGLVDDISVDSMGNVSMGSVVGLRRAGIFSQFLPAQRVQVHCAEGDPPLGVLSEPSELAPNTEAKIPKVEEFFVDLGLSKDEAAARVSPGDAVTMDRLLERSGNRS